MTKLVNRAVVLAKTETNYGVDASPVPATNAILIQNLSYKPSGLRMVARPALKYTLGQLQSVFAGMLMEVSFDCEIKGSGTAGIAPEIDPLLLACGMGATIVADTSCTYLPVSTAMSSCTLYLFEDGDYYALTGCRGDLKLSLKAGGVAIGSFTMTGHLPAAPLKTGSAIVPVYDATVPTPLVGLNFIFGGTHPSPIIETLDVGLGNQVEMPPDLNARDGYGEIIISARAVTGSIDPQADLVTVNDWWGRFVGQENEGSTTHVIGATAGNQFEIGMPAVCMTEITPANRNGIVTYGVNFGAYEDEGDDEISIIFT